MSGYAILGAEIVLAIAAALLVMLCWARRRRAIRERALGVLGVFLIFGAAFLVTAIANQVASMFHGNSFAAAHEPLRFTLASLSLAAAIGGILTMLANRWAFFIRGTRYHSYASFITLVIGIALLGLGAIEIAWLPLCASALFALGGYFLNRPVICSLATFGAVMFSIPPLVLPGFIREAIFHGFYPSALPLAGYLAIVVLPSWLGVVGALRARLVEPRRGVTIALLLALIVAAGVSIAAIAVPEPACSEAETERFGLACEVPEIVEAGG